MSQLFPYCLKIRWKCQVLVEQSTFVLDVKLSRDKLEKKSGYFFLSFFLLSSRKQAGRMSVV